MLLGGASTQTQRQMSVQDSCTAGGPAGAGRASSMRCPALTHVSLPCQCVPLNLKMIRFCSGPRGAGFGACTT